MALNPKLAAAMRNSALDTVLANLANGYLRIYDSTGTGQPADADTAVTTQVLLAELRFHVSSPFAAASAGSAEAGGSGHEITADSSANADGTATWYRALKSDGSTAVMDGSVGTSGANLNLNSVAIASGANVSVSSLTVTMAP